MELIKNYFHAHDESENIFFIKLRKAPGRIPMDIALRNKSLAKKIKNLCNK